jgi:hypothetical protein
VPCSSRRRTRTHRPKASAFAHSLLGKGAVSDICGLAAKSVGVLAPTFVDSVGDLVEFTTVALLGDNLGGVVGEGGHCRRVNWMVVAGSSGSL